MLSSYHPEILYKEKNSYLFLLYIVKERDLDGEDEQAEKDERRADDCEPLRI